MTVSPKDSLFSLEKYRLRCYLTSGPCLWTAVQWAGYWVITDCWRWHLRCIVTSHARIRPIIALNFAWLVSKHLTARQGTLNAKNRCRKITLLAHQLENYEISCYFTRTRLFGSFSLTMAEPAASSDLIKQFVVFHRLVSDRTKLAWCYGRGWSLSAAIYGRVILAQLVTKVVKVMLRTWLLRWGLRRCHCLERAVSVAASLFLSWIWGIAS